MSSIYTKKELLDTFGTTDVSIEMRANYYLNAGNTWTYKLECIDDFTLSLNDRKSLGLFNVYQYGREVMFKFEQDMLYIKLKYSTNFK